MLADSAVKFIKSYAQEIGFDSYREVEVAPNRIVCLMTYLGKSPEKASILLNSHTDVVPADDVNHQYNQTKLWYLRYIFKLDFGFFCRNFGNVTRSRRKCSTTETFTLEAYRTWNRSEFCKSWPFFLLFKYKVGCYWSNQIRHMESIRRMKEQNIRPERSIHVTFVPGNQMNHLN